MLAKIWKKVGLAILIVACLFNIVFKLTTTVKFSDELAASAEYVKEIIAGEQEKTEK